MLANAGVRVSVLALVLLPSLIASSSVFHDMLQRMAVQLFQPSKQGVWIEQRTRFQLLVDRAAAVGKQVVDHPELRYPEAHHLMFLAKRGSPETSNGSLLATLEDIDVALKQLLQQQLPTSFPLARRAILMMMLQWSQSRTQPGNKQQAGVHVGFDVAEDNKVDSILRSLYTLHHTGLRRRGVLEHIHVSKAAGSTMCKLGFKNRCSTKIFKPSGGKGNCLVTEFDDTPRWISEAMHVKLKFPTEGKKTYVKFGQRRMAEVSCASRLEFLRQNKWNYFGNEYTLLLPSQGSTSVHLCPQFVYVLVFRSPFVRLLSHLQYIVEQYAERYKDARISDGFAVMTDRQWQAFAPAVTDNYYIRTLLGEDVFNLHPGAIGEEHLVQAELVLASVDILLDSEFEKMDLLNLHVGLGWEFGFEHAHEKRGKPPLEFLRRQQVPPQLKNMFVRNKWDLCLYNLSKLLGSLDAALFEYADSNRFVVPARASCGHVGLAPDMQSNVTAG